MQLRWTHVNGPLRVHRAASSEHVVVTTNRPLQQTPHTTGFHGGDYGTGKLTFLLERFAIWRNDDVTRLAVGTGFEVKVEWAVDAGATVVRHQLHIELRDAGDGRGVVKVPRA